MFIVIQARYVITLSLSGLQRK